MAVDGLRILSLIDDGFEVLGFFGWSTPFGGRTTTLFAGGGKAWAGYVRGFSEFDVSDPMMIQETHSPPDSTTLPTALSIVANGTGLLPMATFSASQGINALSLYDVSNPQDFYQFLTAVTPPSDAEAVSLYNGLAYVGTGESGLTVINYLATDNQGTSPTLMLNANFSLISPLVEQNTQVRLGVDVSDDFQIRNVEFYMDDVNVFTDGNFPFDFRFTAPAAAKAGPFTLRARVWDTGGNSTWSDEVLVQVGEDLTPPQVVEVMPGDGEVIQPVVPFTFSATFDEPIDPGTLDGNSFRLFAAGLDTVLGTGDDVVVPGGVVSWDGASLAAELEFSSPLPVDQYLAVVSATVSDLGGNNLIADETWTIGVQDAVFWNVDADGAWTDGANWNANAAPVAGDLVLIDRPSGDFTITYSGPTTSIPALLNLESFAMAGGTLSLTGASLISGELGLSGGTLSVIDALEIGGALNWPGGVLNGGGVATALGGVHITGGSNHFFGDSIVRSGGNGSWSGSGGIIVNSAGSFEILPGATFDIQNNEGWVDTIIGDPRYLLRNAGTIIKSAGDPGVATRLVKIAFMNEGLVDLQAGVFRMEDSSRNTGIYQVGASALFEVSAGQHAFLEGSAIQGDGPVLFTGQSDTQITITGAYNVTSSTTIGEFSSPTVIFNNDVQNVGDELNVVDGKIYFNGNQNGVEELVHIDEGSVFFNNDLMPVTPRTLELMPGGELGGSGIVEVEESVQWLGGRLSGVGRLVNSTSMSISGDPKNLFDSRILENVGEIVYSGPGDIHMRDTSTIENSATGTFEYQGDLVINDPAGSNEAIEFRNHGLLLRSMGEGPERTPPALRQHRDGRYHDRNVPVEETPLQ